MAHSALVIPVPELEPMVRRRMQRALPEFMFADPASIHAHITVLGPFAAAEAIDTLLLNTLRDIIATTVTFGFTFDGVRHVLDDGTVCLQPEPAGSFSALTTTLWNAFPDFSPSGGATGTPTPYVTLDYPSAPRAVDGDDRDTATIFPVRSTAREVCLNWYEPGASRTLATFPLGKASASGIRLDPEFERILQRIIPALADALVPNDIDLLAAGLDSMAAVQLLSEIDATYDVEIPDEALLGNIFTSPAALWAVVRQQVDLR